jgi:hypothetical protein
MKLMNRFAEIMETFPKADLDKELLSEKIDPENLIPARFGEIEIDDLFVYIGDTLRKTSHRNANSVAPRNKKHFIFNSGDLVSKIKRSFEAAFYYCPYIPLIKRPTPELISDRTYISKDSNPSAADQLEDLLKEECKENMKEFNEDVIRNLKACFKGETEKLYPSSKEIAAKTVRLSYDTASSMMRLYLNDDSIPFNSYKIDNITRWLITVKEIFIEKVIKNLTICQLNGVLTIDGDTVMGEEKTVSDYFDPIKWMNKSLILDLETCNYKVVLNPEHREYISKCQGIDSRTRIRGSYQSSANAFSNRKDI